MAIAISVKNVGKQYRIGAAQTKFKYGMLREVIVDAAMSPVRIYKALTGKATRGTSGSSYFWALKDISFDVEEGKVLGIVGRTGLAGKGLADHFDRRARTALHDTFHQ